MTKEFALMTNSCVLIVDDEPSGRDVLAGLLARENYQLILAEDGFEALAKAREYLPDLILLDLMMPKLDGFEVCQQLRADPVLSDVPILLVTALDDRESWLKGLEVGADDFISKPFDRIELRTRVKSITRLNRQQRLMEERKKFEWVVENLEEGYILLTQEGRIHYLNPQACVYLQCTKRNSLNQAFIELARAHYQLEPVAAWSADWLQETDGHRTLFLLQPETMTQQALWLQLDILALPAQTNATWLLRLKDNSEQVSLQNRIWTFQHFVSHKLRTPLNGLNALSLIDVEQYADEKTKLFFNMARLSADRLESAILRILHYVEAPSVLHLQQVTALTALSQQVSKIAQEFNIPPPQVIIEPIAAEAYYLPLPSELLELLLEELINNSKKFHPQQQPKITIELRVNESNNTVYIAVNDDGCTLPMAVLSKVFIPYFQHEKGFTGEVAGMGLGLAIVNNLISNLGGHCIMSNCQPGPGVSVKLELPLIKQSTPVTVVT
jgi:DNA-binding response OmpR family regulator